MLKSDWPKNITFNQVKDCSLGPKVFSAPPALRQKHQFCQKHNSFAVLKVIETVFVPTVLRNLKELKSTYGGFHNITFNTADKSEGFVKPIKLFPARLGFRRKIISIFCCFSDQTSSIANLHWDRGGGGVIPTGIIGY